MSFKATMIERQSIPTQKPNIEGFFVISLLCLLGLYGADIISGEWVVITMVINLGFTYYQITRESEKRKKQVLNNKFIFFDTKEIIIKTKSAINQQFELSNVNEIIVKEEYFIERDDFVRLKEEFPYKDIGNFILLKIGEIEHRFDFAIDSHYMIKQLEKTIEHWLENGYTVVYAE